MSYDAAHRNALLLAWPKALQVCQVLASLGRSSDNRAQSEGYANILHIQRHMWNNNRVMNVM